MFKTLEYERRCNHCGNLKHKFHNLRKCFDCHESNVPQKKFILIEVGNKRKCVKCNEFSELENFDKTNHGSTCKLCNRLWKKNHRKNNLHVREAERKIFIRKHFKKTYDISVEKYQEMLKTQKGLCKICEQPETAINHRSKLPVKLSVDHCHETKKVRGLLCLKCNQAIGLLKHDIEIMKKAIIHLS